MIARLILSSSHHLLPWANIVLYFYNDLLFPTISPSPDLGHLKSLRYFIKTISLISCDARLTKQVDSIFSHKAGFFDCPDFPPKSPSSI